MSADATPLIERLAGLALQWEQDAARRRDVWPDDPIAAGRVACASDLRVAVRNAEAAMLEDSVEEYARANGVTPQTARAWCRRRLVTARKTSKGWMVLRSSPPPSGPVEARA